MVRTTAALCLVVLASCAGKKSAHESVDDIAQLICDAAFRCCERGEIDFYFGPFVDEATCAERLQREAELDTASLIAAPFENAGIIVPNIAVLQQAIEDDRAAIDEDALAVCLEFLRALSCNDFVIEEPVEGCQPPEPEVELPCDLELIVIGRVGESGSCSSPGTSFECKSGLVCRAVDSLGVNGVCVRPGVEGDFCFDDSECDEEHYCSLVNGTCQLPSEQGETCKYADEDDPTPSASTLLVRCAEGLSCDPVTDVCVGACERGARCGSDDACDVEAGLRCIVGRCDSPRAAGVPCQTSADCQDGLRCALNPVTGTDNTCQALLANGETCSPYSTNECASGFCDPTLEACAPQVSPGGLCPSAQHQQCSDGYCETDYVYCTADADCAAVSGVCNTSSYRCEYFCIELLPDGAQCLYDHECVSSDCVDQFCRTTPLANGQPCDSDGQCGSEFCNYESPRVCEELPLPNGRACAFAGQCASGVCHENSCQEGLSEGADCSSTFDPPCAVGLYCDRETSPATCVPKLAPGAACDSSEQCRGNCTTRFNRRMCDATPDADAAVCDGE